MKLGILFTSRNNYDLLDYWLTKVNTNNIFILNIDEDSTIENKDKGRMICDKHNITYIEKKEVCKIILPQLVLFLKIIT